MGNLELAVMPASSAFLLGDYSLGIILKIEKMAIYFS